MVTRIPHQFRWFNHLLILEIRNNTLLMIIQWLFPVCLGKSIHCQVDSVKRGGLGHLEELGHQMISGSLALLHLRVSGSFSQVCQS